MTYAERIASFADRLARAWDRMVYKLSLESIRRSYERDPALAYLLHLTIGDWLKRHPISDAAKAILEQYHHEEKAKYAERHSQNQRGCHV